MTLTSAIDGYLTLKRSLGAGLQAQESILRAFGRAVGDIPLDAITAEVCATFCRGTGAPTQTWPRHPCQQWGLKTTGCARVPDGVLTSRPRLGMLCCITYCSAFSF